MVKLIRTRQYICQLDASGGT